MTTNFVNVFRHFGPNAEKVLLGKLGLKFGKEYFFEYDENYVSSFPNRYLEAIQTCTLLLSSLFDKAERGDSFTTRATPEVLSETVWFNDFQPT